MSLRRFAGLFLLLPLAAASSGDGIDTGEKLLAAGRMEEARAYYDKALGAARTRSEKGRLFYARARATADGESRIRAYQEFLSEYGDHALAARATTELAWLGLLTGRAAIGVPLLEKSNGQPVALLELARLRIVTGRQREVAAILDRIPAAAPAPQRAEAAYLRAVALRALGRNKDASRSFLQALEIAPRSDPVPAVLLALAELAGDEGDQALGRDYLQKLLEGFPRSIEARLARGRLNLLKAHSAPVREQTVFEIQIGAYGSEALARDAIRRFDARGVVAFLHEVEGSGLVRHTVRVGYFRNRAEAEDALRRLTARNIEGFILSRKVRLTEDGHGR